jgi:glycosyltransferase involved in cell wall biosynthesis
VIGPAGWTFPEDDLETLQARLLRLMQEVDARAELGRLGRERVLERFTQARIAAETVQVYKEMLA